MRRLQLTGRVIVLHFDRVAGGGGGDAGKANPLVQEIDLGTG